MELHPTHEVMREAVERIGVKKVAAALGVSASLVYKWCQEPRTDEHEDASGAASPLDRVVRIVQMSDDREVLHFLCRAADGYFTPNPHAHSKAELKFVTETVAILNNFADLMHYAERSLYSDGKIDRTEAEKLRRDWDRLKSRLEHFTSACERGQFDLAKDDQGRKPSP